MADPPDPPQPAAAAPTPTATRPPSTPMQSWATATPPSLGALFRAVVESGRPARAFIVILTGIMFIYLVALIHSPAVPPPAVASIPSAIPLKPRYEWTFLYSASAGKLGVTLVQPEVWKDEWQTLASLLMHYELDLSAFAGNNKGQPWAFRGVTRLPGPAEFLVVPDSRNGSAGEAAALLLRTSEAEELAYKLVVIEPLPSTPQPPTGFSGSGYTLSPTCEVAGLSPERPGCFPHVPSPVTLKESSFPGSLTVNRFAGGPNGLFYAREKEKEMFRFHSLDGKVDHTSLPISNPLSRLRPLFLAPILGDGGIPAVLDVRYALTDSQLSFEAFVYAHSGVSGYVFRPPNFAPEGVPPEWKPHKLVSVGLPTAQSSEALIRLQLSIPLNPAEQAILDDPAQLHFLSRPHYASTGDTITFVFLSHIFTVHSLPPLSPGGPRRFKATQQPMPALDFTLRPELLAVHRGKWMLIVGESGELVVFRKGDPEEGTSEAQGTMDDLGNYIPPIDWNSGSQNDRQADAKDPRSRAQRLLELRHIQAGWQVHSAARLPGDTDPASLVFLDRGEGSPPAAVVLSSTHAHFVALGTTSLHSNAVFFSDHRAMVTAMAAVVSFFALGEMGWVDARNIVPMLVFFGWGVLMWSVVS